MTLIIVYAFLAFIATCLSIYREGKYADPLECFMVGLFWPLFLLISLCFLWSACAKWVVNKLTGMSNE